MFIYNASDVFAAIVLALIAFLLAVSALLSLLEKLAAWWKGKR